MTIYAFTRDAGPADWPALAREFKIGDRVHRYQGHDLGLTTGDRRLAGVETIACTLDGTEPFFTVPADWLRDVTHRDAVVAALKANFFLEGNGHSITKPDFYTKNGFPEEFVNGVACDHKSDGSLRGTIFDDNGNPIRKVRGVYNLDMLRRVAGLIGADQFPPMTGRGFQAQALVINIKAKLAEITETA